MKNGYRVIDMDTHVNPSFDTLVKYMDPSFKARIEELDPYLRVQDYGSGKFTTITVAPYPYDRFPGEAPQSENTQLTAGGRGALEKRVTKRSSHHRIDPQPGVQDEDASARLGDMDMEGRDVDLLIPGTWCTAVSGVKDVTLIEGLYRAYHNYIAEYCAQAPDRLKSMVLIPGADPAWAVEEVRRLKKEKWVSSVWPLLPPDMPVDHPCLNPLWDEMNDAHLPIIFHSFFYEPPYFPGYRDVWGNAAVARTAAHPWAAARFLSYLIVGQIFDRYPNINAAASEVGHGWLPHWVTRLGEMVNYVGGATPQTKYEPIDYVRMGRFRVGAEPFEGPEITKFCVEMLGEDALMHQSDYPHGESHFPDTVEMVMEWDFWKDKPDSALRKFMSGNAESFLRLL
ncbi:amidohydrolase family protein [Paraburkholderia sp.]|uniref:amidohydrolase family protein n=1 Tax=Paraburkholderia sp. TaxID=1926495 RepID=UPI0039E60283